jgi:hypothetical protein
VDVERGARAFLRRRFWRFAEYVIQDLDLKLALAEVP